MKSLGYSSISMFKEHFSLRLIYKNHLDSLLMINNHFVVLIFKQAGLFIRDVYVRFQLIIPSEK